LQAAVPEGETSELVRGRFSGDIWKWSDFLSQYINWLQTFSYRLGPVQRVISVLGIHGLRSRFQQRRCPSRGFGAEPLELAQVGKVNGRPGWLALQHSRKIRFPWPRHERAKRLLRGIVPMRGVVEPAILSGPSQPGIAPAFPCSPLGAIEVRARGNRASPASLQLGQKDLIFLRVAPRRASAGLEAAISPSRFRIAAIGASALRLGNGDGRAQRCNWFRHWHDELKARRRLPTLEDDNELAFFFPC